MDKNTLDKINALTRRKFKAEELYTFPVVLCHNDIDRDYERFTDDALDALAELFVGKTIIQNHDPSSDNQVARIYATEVVTDPERATAWGGAYRYLKGYAYMAKTASNADLITEIDAGIKKEVSVGCSTAKRTCSVCGADAGTCGHQKGHVYDGQICCHVLDGANDAYELSFVAVPAQPGAGVTKHFTEKGGTTMEFTPITTQADFDAAVQEAVDAAVAAKAAEFEGFVSPADHQKALDDMAAEHKTALRKAYREKAATQYGLPAELAERLVGDTEEDITKDAEKLAGLTKGMGTPSFDTEGGEPMSDVEKYFYGKNKHLDPRTRKENA